MLNKLNLPALAVFPFLLWKNCRSREMKEGLCLGLWSTFNFNSFRCSPLDSANKKERRKFSKNTLSQPFVRISGIMKLVR